MEAASLGDGAFNPRHEFLYIRAKDIAGQLDGRSEDVPSAHGFLLLALWNTRRLVPPFFHPCRQSADYFAQLLDFEQLLPTLRNSFRRSVIRGKGADA